LKKKIGGLVCHFDGLDGSNQSWRVKNANPLWRTRKIESKL